MAVHSINQSCKSIMYMIISGDQRTTSTMPLGSLPRSEPGAHSVRSSAQISRVGWTRGAIWKLYENQNLRARRETQKKSYGILEANGVWMPGAQAQVQVPPGQVGSGGERCVDACHKEEGGRSQPDHQTIGPSGHLTTWQLTL